MTVPFAFANLSGNIALSKLDSNFNTPITIGNSSVLLGNTITTLNNMTLANVTISSGNIAFPVPAASGGTGLVSPGTTGNVLTSNGTSWVSTGAAPGSGVTAISFGSTGLTPNTSSSGNVTVSGTLVAANGGTGHSSLTANSVLLGNGASAIQFVSPGNNGNVLTSTGTTWSSAAPSGGSAMTLISTQSLGGTYFVQWTGLSGYNNYMLIINNFQNNSVQTYFQVGTGSTTWITSNYARVYANLSGGITPSWGLGYSTFDSSDFWAPIFSGSPRSGSVLIANMTNGYYTTAQSELIQNDPSTPNPQLNFIYGQNSSTTTKTAIRLIASDGSTNFLSGTASLYGISS